MPDTCAPPIRLRVDPSGGGDAPNLGKALSLLPDPPGEGGALILMEAGTYREKNALSYPGLRVSGAGKDKTTLVWGDYALMPGKEGLPVRTFATSTLLLEADGVSLSDLRVANDAGWGAGVGQAIALYADADRLRVERCAISARQDSLFLGPLPPSPIEGTVFGGPRDGLPRRQGRQLYRSCLIEGDVDFIFGSAQALFLGCRVRSLDRPGQVGPRGYVAAPSTPAGSDFGLVFAGCSLEAGAGLPDDSVFLARPWRDEAQAVFHACTLGNHIKRELWDDWEKPAAREKSFFAQLDCRAAGSGAFRGRPWQREISLKRLGDIYDRFARAFSGIEAELLELLDAASA